MTYLRYIILPFLLLLSFASCTQEEAGTDVAGEVRLTLDIPGAILSKSVAAETGESTITNVYLLFYPQEATDSDKPAFFCSQTGLSAEGSWSKTFKTTEMPQLEPYVTYDVYALASLPSGVSAPTEGTTKATLLALQENLTDQNTASWAISFSGQSTYTTGTLGELKIDLKRTVARVDITIDNQTSMSMQNITLTLAKEPSSVFYLKDKTDSPLEKSNREVSPDADGHFRFYLYEHTADSHPVWIYLRGTTSAGEGTFHLIELRPEGSSEIKRNYIYKMKLTLREGDVTISTSQAIDWSASVETNPSLGPLTPQPSANTYILAPGGQSIIIPVNRLSQVRSEFGSKAVVPMEDNEKLEASLIWTDVKGSISGLGLAVDASIADIHLSGIGPNAYLQVTSGTQPGNSLVAVLGSMGQAEWSWQIWVTDYDPEVTNVTVDKSTGGSLTFMDRNLGALANSGETNVVGNYYQWGRSIPLPTRNTEKTGLVPVYDENGEAVKIKSLKLNNIRETIEMPWMYANNLSIYYENRNLWDDAKKTVFDPCPAGWRIPTKEEWITMPPMYPVSANGEVIGQTIGENTNLYVPRTYRIKAEEDQSVSFDEYENLAFSWSTTKDKDKEGNAESHCEYNKNQCILTEPITCGIPVRCIKE